MPQSGTDVHKKNGKNGEQKCKYHLTRNSVNNSNSHVAVASYSLQCEISDYGFSSADVVIHELVMSRSDFKHEKKDEEETVLEKVGDSIHTP
jgi:hypothetical protein